MLIILVAVPVGITLLLTSSMAGPSLPSNQIVLHNHVILNVTLNGKSITVPALIGIAEVGKVEDPLLYGDHSLDKYGMQGMSSLHTHDNRGTIHVESNTKRDYTLGEFLDIWKGLDVNGKTVKVIVDGNPVSDFRNIILNDGDSISLNVS